ncbi:hypothetical protein [Hahella sp. HN01]|uniref:hypothetical protein n=1 Tax=Hahella sp. HN01 TaxID=2847262 RepID=UPI001C1EC58B|nr:hypothetical protein [Hahella sp. HN01]MBU6955947.1 hypothetical protein [Hahella sp. HN01]
MDRDLNSNIYIFNGEYFVGTIMKAQDILDRLGVRIDEKSTLFLYDPEMEEGFYIESAISIDNIIDRFNTWPQLGCVGLRYKNGSIDVSYLKEPKETFLRCVQVSFSENIYTQNNEISFVVKTIVALHEGLNAFRTISDIEEQALSHDNVTTSNKMYWLDVMSREMRDECGFIPSGRGHELESGSFAFVVDKNYMPKIATVESLRL